LAYDNRKAGFIHLSKEQLFMQQAPNFVKSPIQPQKQPVPAAENVHNSFSKKRK
jgi:hypothetical protein